MSTNNLPIPRFLRLPKDHSFFLFGPRGTGKSTLVFNSYNEKNSLFINLLDTEVEERFTRRSKELLELIEALPEKIRYIVIDEVQKVPKLLDIVHYLIEKNKKIFIMTGSSARKLKLGHSNLLAGRAFVYNLHPFSYLELGSRFDLKETLQWGLLPKIFSLKTEKAKMQFLQAYAHTYLKEEIWAEQFVKELDPFRYFLEVAAQMNGKIINYSNLSRDIGVDDKTIKKYFSILEDTLIGFFLDGFKHSFRKRLNTKSKFYFFDIGVKRALSRTLTLPLNESTSAYGEVFEHMVILECFKLASYYKSEYRFSYLRTKDDAEIDLVVERPGKPVLFIEIKSSKQVTEESLRILKSLSKDFGNCESVCFSNDPYEKLINGTKVIPWNKGIKRFFGR
ncbi:MAG: ATP-binding protein [Candidatus Melainabacteria bacterium]|nr:ATP-binding protein [Candidatus Melainabacteria bacterium]